MCNREHGDATRGSDAHAQRDAGHLKNIMASKTVELAARSSLPNDDDFSDDLPVMTVALWAAVDAVSAAL